MTDAFAASAAPLPGIFDSARAARTLAELGEGEGAYAPPPAARAAFEAAFGNSPYLARLALRERDLLPELVARGPGALMDEIGREALAAAGAGDIKAAMARFAAGQAPRRARRGAGRHRRAVGSGARHRRAHRFRRRLRLGRAAFPARARPPPARAWPKATVSARSARPACRLWRWANTAPANSIIRATSTSSSSTTRSASLSAQVGRRARQPPSISSRGWSSC